MKLDYISEEMDDIDLPNIASGFCPECGQKANIPVGNHWECTFCNWHGIPDRTSYLDICNKAFEEMDNEL